MFIKGQEYWVKCDKCGTVATCYEHSIDRPVSYTKEMIEAIGDAFEDEFGWQEKEGRHFCEDCCGYDDEKDEWIMPEPPYINPVVEGWIPNEKEQPKPEDLTWVLAVVVRQFGEPSVECVAYSESVGFAPHGGKVTHWMPKPALPLTPNPQS